MTSRERFEAWHTANMGKVEIMEDIMIERRWKIWQAAYAAGQEAMRKRAVDLCISQWPMMHEHWGPGQARAACEDCARSIRALEIER